MEFQNRSFRNRLKCIFGKSYRTARKNFQGENYKIFDLSQFRKETIQIVFDALHGIDNEKARDEIFIIKYLFQIGYLLLIVSLQSGSLQPKGLISIVIFFHVYFLARIVTV